MKDMRIAVVVVVDGVKREEEGAESKIAEARFGFVKTKARQATAGG